MHERASRTGDGFMLVYSVSSRQSLHQIPEYHQMIKTYSKDAKSVVIILVGNKCDLTEAREVSFEGESFALPLHASRTVLTLFGSACVCLKRWTAACERTGVQVLRDVSEGRDERGFGVYGFSATDFDLGEGTRCCRCGTTKAFTS